MNSISKQLAKGWADGIGTVVTDIGRLLHVVGVALLQGRWEQSKAPDGTLIHGQGTISLKPEEYSGLVSSGTAPRSAVKEYVRRTWRSMTEDFALRTDDLPKPENCLVVVYTGAAYRNDPDVLAGRTGETADELNAIGDGDWVIVAVLAAIGPRPQPSCWRFVNNIAGGNRRYDSVPEAVKMAAREAIKVGPEAATNLVADMCGGDWAASVRDEAVQVRDYNKSWVTVAT